MSNDQRTDSKKAEKKDACAPKPLLREDEVGSLLVPVIVGGTFLAYSYVREFHRAYGITR